MLETDNTQALISLAENSPNPSGIDVTNKLRITQEHPTFDTNYWKKEYRPSAPVLRKAHHYLKENLVSVVLTGLMVFILAFVAFWQLQPQPPKYIAVVPPTLNADTMSDDQQELIKGAVYDAIQQSVIRLDDFYLIPQAEVIDTNGDILAVQRATAADEIITTDIKCHSGACTIQLSRLASPSSQPDSRLRVTDTKTMDVLIDNYLSTAETVHRNVSALYASSLHNSFDNINEHDYKKSLLLFRTYGEVGATEALLNEIDSLPKKVKTLATIRRMYSEISLDLFYETRNPNALKRLEEFRESISPIPEDAADLIDVYYLEIAKKAFDQAHATINKLLALNGSHALYNQLAAYAMLEKNDYTAAIDHYQKSLTIKKSADTLVGISNAYRYLGDTKASKKFLKQALDLSPHNHKIHSLYGLTALVEGNIEEALTSFEFVIEKNPMDISNLNSFGLANLLNKEYDKALAAFQQAYALSKHNSTLLLNIADSYILAGNQLAGKETYQQIIKAINPTSDNNEDLRNLAQAYAHTDQFRHALTILKKLEKADPENIETFYTAALVHALANNNTTSILTTGNALEKGMHRIWFNFPWFDSLCAEKDFVILMQEKGGADRCPTLQANN